MAPATVTAYIGLGSNLQDREQFIYHALRMLQELPQTHMIQCSSLYETDPVGYTEQPLFLNMVAGIETELLPVELLQRCMQIEKELGRTREIRWGPRTIDLDILLYGDQKVICPELCIPHPRMRERPFVLIPLLEIMPITDPHATSLQSALDKLEGREGVRLWKHVNWSRELALYVK